MWRVCKPLSARWQRQNLCGQADFEFFDHTTKRKMTRPQVMQFR
jgi:hypothetical protein